MLRRVSRVVEIKYTCFEIYIYIYIYYIYIYIFAPQGQPGSLKGVQAYNQLVFALSEEVDYGGGVPGLIIPFFKRPLLNGLPEGPRRAILAR